jgi:putative ABC transport system permease protein
MLKNYLKIVLRKMRSQKVYTFINVSGLAIGMAAATFILLWVRDERSYDRFHKNADRIYRVYQVFHYGDYHLEQAQTPAALAPRLKDESPDVELATRVRGYRDEQIVKVENRKFNERGLGIADEYFFQLFSFPLLAGDPATVLAKPYTAAVSEKAARKYFGSAEAVGRVLTIFEENYTVTGVFKDMPNRSHFHLDVLCSFASFKQYQQPAWGINVFKTYALLPEKGRREAVEGQLTDIVKNHMFNSPQRYEAVTARGDYTKFPLQRLTDIHLGSHLLWEFEANGNSTYVKFFTIIAVFILLIAAINYVNLSTARFAGRAREVGIRKTVGSTRLSLIRQFLLESVLTAFLAMMLSLATLAVLMPAFRNLVGKPWLELPFVENMFLLVPWAFLAVLVGIIAGVYPAFFLSSFEPASVLSGKFSRGLRRSGLRNGLVVVQFSLSVLLLVATMVVGKQMRFIQNQNLGYDQDQVVVVPTYGELAQKLPVLKDALRRHPAVVSVSASSSAPGTGFTNIGMGLEGSNSNTGTNMYIVDADFLDVMKMELAEGRFFDRKIPTDGQAVVLNQSMVRKLSATDLLGKRMRIWSGPKGDALFPIIGIVKDFHYESFHEPIKPLVMVMLNGTVPWEEAYLAIRVQTAQMQKTLSEIRQTWESVVPGTPFKHSFLDSLYEAQYQNEARTGRVFTIFTLLAIFVACIGLLGLASFAVEQRTKEIGIRKVLGASVRSLVLMLSSEFARWVALANLIAWPLAYYLMTQWLRSFAYRTGIGVLPFLFSAFVVLAVAALTVGYHALRSAVAKPVDSLRYE